MIILTKVSETSSKITLGWTPVPGCIGYVFYADDTRVSNTWDPTKNQVTFAKGPAEFRVVAVEQEDEGVYPPVVPPVGTLRWKPPGYPNYAGYTTIQANVSAQQFNLDNTKDYVIDLTTKAWSSQSSGRSIGMHINGGRNVVVIGGALLFNSTNNQDDSTAILVDVGDPTGIVHLEGLNIDCANGITVRTRRIVQIENCRIRVRTWNDDHDGGSGIHPDIVQVWGTNTQQTPCAAIRMHRVTGLTRYSGLVCLTEITPGDPLRWDRYDVDLHPDVNNNGKKDAGNFAYMCSGGTGAAEGPYCEYHGVVYAELPTGGGGAYVRGIDDITCLRTLVGGLKVFPYEIKNASGSTVYTSPNAPAGGSGTAAAKTPGNYLTYDRVPKFVDHKWIVGNPPGGQFVPVNLVGPTYVSPGYL